MALVEINVARCGVARTGFARVGADNLEYIAEGGMAFSSTASALVEYVPAASGNISFSGDAYVTVDPYLATMSGGVALSGTSDAQAEFLVVVSPESVNFSGDAVYQSDFIATGSGSLTLSGDSDDQAEYIATASGSMSLSGDSIDQAEYIADGSGEFDLSGYADATIEFSVSMSGGVVSSGLADGIEANYIDILAGSGQLTLGGESLAIFQIDLASLPVFILRYDGDVRLSLSSDGGFIRMRDGQTEMDQGLETAVTISLMSEGMWWGNSLAAEGEDVGSGFLESLRQPLTNQARLDVIEAAKASLAWLVDTGIATSVEVDGEIPSIGRLYLSITINQPVKSPATFRYTINWQAQRIHLQEAAA